MCTEYLSDDPHGTYRVIFKGRIIEGSDLEDVKPKMVNLFAKKKLTAEELFSGKAVELNSNLTRETAENFQAALHKIGAVCEIEAEQKQKKVKMAPSETVPLSQEKREHYANLAQVEMLMYTMENKKRSFDVKTIFKWVRIAAMFFLLVGVSLVSYMNSSSLVSWEEPVIVVIYPVNEDNTDASESYINNLKADDFAPVLNFFEEEAQYFELKLKNPIKLFLAPEVKYIPPPPPEKRSTLETMLWSLNLRIWAYINDTYEADKDIKLFALYSSTVPANSIEKSYSIEKARVGVIKAQTGKDQTVLNHFVIIHELLHCLGAKDKYDPTSHQPIFPTGYSDPDKKPLYPQESAEVMAGRISLSESDSYQPNSLHDVVIGDQTAREINWLQNNEVGN